MNPTDIFEEIFACWLYLGFVKPWTHSDRQLCTLMCSVDGVQGCIADKATCKEVWEGNMCRLSGHQRVQGDRNGFALCKLDVPADIRCQAGKRAQAPSSSWCELLSCGERLQLSDWAMVTPNGCFCEQSWCPVLADKVGNGIF